MKVLKLSLSPPFFLHAKEHLTYVLIRFDCNPLGVLKLEIQHIVKTHSSVEPETGYRKNKPGEVQACSKASLPVGRKCA